MSKAILYDATLCIGCQECERGCAKENNLRYDDAVNKERATSDHKYTYVAFGKGDKYMRRLCMHCADPTCASVCPVGALSKTKLGPVVYDESKCIGCRYCMVACPFGIPKYEWSKALPGVRKCTMCFDRQSAGKATACAEACPTGATICGDRSSLLAEAHRRLRENPNQFINHVYGESEVGGTSVLLISSEPFEKYGYPIHYGSEALPPLTGRVLAHVPDVALLGWAVLGGIWWITNRRDAVAAATERPREDHGQEPK